MVDSCISEEDTRSYIEAYVLDAKNEEKPALWKTWVFGMAMVTATAFAAAIAVLITPFLSKRIYNRLLVFLFALGVGNLTGCIFFILFPQAFYISALGNVDYVVKAWMMLGGCYLLFIIEKMFILRAELKKKKKVQSVMNAKNAAETRMQSQINGPPSQKIQGLIGGIDADGPEEIPRALSMMSDTLQNHHFTPHVVPRFTQNQQGPPSAVKEVSKTAIESELQSEALLALLGAWANNFIDGMTMGVSFGDSPLRGLTVGLAILSQQFPEEVDSLVIVMSSGVGLTRAMLLNLVQAALSYLGFVIAALIDDRVEQFDTYIYAIAAGNYFYICLGCLMPEMSEKIIENVRINTKEGLLIVSLQFIGIAIGLVFMFLMALKGKDITLHEAD